MVTVTLWHKRSGILTGTGHWGVLAELLGEIVIRSNPNRYLWYNYRAKSEVYLYSSLRPISPFSGRSPGFARVRRIVGGVGGDESRRLGIA